MMRRSLTGFTLIELLVVIAIIGLLSAVVLASLKDARARGRDSQRLTSVTELQKSVELYFSTYNEYPTACGLTARWRGHAANYGDCDTNYIADVVPAYLTKLPIDPMDDVSDGFIYRVSADRQNYKIMSYRKVETKVLTAGEPNARCAASCSDPYCTENTFARYSAVPTSDDPTGAACW